VGIIAKSAAAALDDTKPAGRMAMPEAIPQSTLKQFLTSITAIITNPDTVTRLLALIERNELAVEKYRLEVAELAAAREQLRKERAEHSERIAQLRNEWMAEERERRSRLERDERTAEFDRNRTRLTPQPEHTAV
jgi:hypothetical protein